ncbi:MAG: glycosyltransferase family 4 protein [Planctomycetes bacterium]|nr:glycosyltransferase family 4 protein [Planctomycetota bacterium]
MRVLHIITRMIVGGAQENTRFNCMDLVSEYRDDVTLITGPSLGAEGSLFDQTEDPSQTSLLKVIEEPTLLREIHPWIDQKAYRQLRTKIRRMRPDVVHTHSAKAGMLGRAAAWHENVPCVIHTVHGAPFHPYQNVFARRFFQACERWAAKRCHHMISVADAMTDLMVEAHIAERSKFTTIYSGMDVEPFLRAATFRDQTRRELGLKPEHVVFGKIARLFRLKGHEYLLEAAKEVVSKVQNARFLLVGDGILRNEIEGTIASMGLKDHFVFTGLVPPSRIPALVGAMDALVHTSLREGLARALPQALIAGRPVISFDIDGAREVVIDDETGFLLPPRCVAPLAGAIVQLAEDPKLRKRLGSEGQNRFAEKFRHQNMTKEIRGLYAQILRGHNP